MSDRSVEDELIAEARKFGHSLTHMLRLHAQATNWLERRKVRKQISLALREQRRAEETARKHQLVWTQGIVDRYRAHALAVAERAHNPSVDHERRYRDAQSLTRHANDLRARIVANDRLTKTEQGIALDGLDAATTFPQFEPGRLFHKAHKVRGIDALRYRAQVARTIREQRTHNPPREQRRAPTPEQAEAIQQIRRAEIDGDAARWSQQRHAMRQRAASDAVQAGLSNQQITQEFNDAPVNSLYRTTITSRYGTHQHDEPVGLHATEPEAAVWAAGRVKGTYWGPGVSLSVTTTDSDGRRRFYSGQGNPEFVADEVMQWRDRAPSRNAEVTGVRELDERLRGGDRTDPPPEQPRPDHDRLAEVERQLQDMIADRDRLGSRVGMLQRGLDSVTADRNEMRRKLDSAEGHIEALKNRNLRLASEIGELRDRPGVEQLIAERDQFKQQRDEAVRKLVQFTPEQQRYGNRQRSNGNGGKSEPTTESGRQSGDTGPVGKRASYLRDVGTGHEQAGPDTQSWPRPGRNGQGRNGIERSR
ncbi:hypothetical protein IU459_04570 [Nocardia amamiensis]|uniref:Uncharacterized protein n=1 Tax=Nocardia amamiensis TaxID=404578 RepID=A0ABS0CQ04_9NOCA|nr:hypothetical protein [Nocardia amamiensis]MBF6296818.1 hypothetical protein [Nocardia amamiensis]